MVFQECRLRDGPIPLPSGILAKPRFAAALTSTSTTAVKAVKSSATASCPFHTVDALPPHHSCVSTDVAFRKAIVVHVSCQRFNSHSTLVHSGSSEGSLATFCVGRRTRASIYHSSFRATAAAHDVHRPRAPNIQITFSS